MNYDNIIYNAAIKSGFTKISALLVVAQARLESADYTSNVFQKNNNLFGMKYVKQPLAEKGTKSPEGDYYAKYKNVTDSINDLIKRNYNLLIGGVSPQELKNSTDSSDFANKLKKRRYFGATAQNYAAGLVSKLKKIDTTKLAVGSGIIIIIIASILFIIMRKK